MGKSVCLGSRLVFCYTPRNHDPMSLPLSIEFSDAVYHVASRGNQREPTFDVNQHQLSLLRQKTRRDPAGV